MIEKPPRTDFRESKSVQSEPIVAGIQAVATALKNNPASIRFILVAANTGNQRVRDLALMAGDSNIEVRTEARQQLDQIAGFERHQDIVALLHAHKVPAEADLLPLLQSVSGHPLVLVLDGVQDPHNLGACLRTAEAAGVHAVVIPKDRSVGLTPVVRKTSAGASEIIPLFQVTNLARVLRDMKAAGIWIAGTSDQAHTSVYQQDLTGPLALVMGGEGDGIRRLTADLCDYLVSIPMNGVIESLNVSVATGICLFEIRRQRSLVAAGR